LAGLWLAVVLAAMLAGLPWILVRLFGMPFPRHPPQQPYLHEWIASAAVLAGWLLWLVLVALVGLQVRAAVHRVRLPRPHLADPPEGLLAGLLGAAVVAFTTAGSRGAMPAPPVPAAAAPTPPLAGHTPTPTATTASLTAAPVGSVGQVEGTYTTGPPPSWPSGASTGAGDAGSATDPAPDAGAQGTAHAGDTTRTAPADPGGEVTSTPAGPETPAVPGGPAAGRGTDDAGRLPGGGSRLGVDLPDGWVDRDTAQAVSAVVGLWWLRRRRRYLPRPPSGSGRLDADLTRPPPTAVAIVQALHDPDLDHPADAPPGVPAPPAPAGQPATGAATAPLAGRGPLWHPAQLAPGGLGLTGPGAPAAVRGVLTAVLLGAGQPPGAGRVWTSAADLAGLLGTAAAGLDRPPGLQVYPDVDELLAAAETNLLHRSATATSPDPVACSPPDGQPPPAPVLLITGSPPDPAQARRLAIMLTHTAGGLNGVLLGTWPHGRTWHVDPDGSTHPLQPPGAGDRTGPGLRLCVLAPRAAADLFTLLAHATPGHRQPPASDHRPQTDRPAPDTPAHAGPPSPVPAAGVEGAAPGGGSVPLALRLLGGVDLHPTDHPEVPLRLGRNAAMQVLAFLAVYPAGADAGELAALIWPGVRPRPLGRLYKAVSTLRTTITRATGVDLLGRDGERYRLDHDQLRIDLHDLTTAVDTAAAAVDVHHRTRALQQVINLYRGEVAAGQSWAWITPLRETVRRNVIDAYTTLAQDGDPSAAAALLRDALAVDPVNEELYRQAMRAYAAAGQPDQAGVLLGRLTRQLAELGEHPDRDTLVLAHQLTR